MAITTPSDGNYGNLYYSSYLTNETQPILEAVVERLNYYIAEILYKKEYDLDGQSALNRIFQADTNSGDETLLGDAVEQFKTNLHKYPFTVYNIGDPTNDRLTESSTLTPIFTGEYSEEIQKILIEAIPRRYEIYYVTFFANNLDFHRAHYLSSIVESKLTRLNAYLKLNNIPVTLPFDINFDISKGGLTYELELQKSLGKLSNLNITATINFYDFNLEDLPSAEVQSYLVDTIEDPNQSINLNLLSISNTTPETNSNVDLSTFSNKIIIEFSHPIEPSTLNIQVSPYVSYYFNTYDFNTKACIYLNNLKADQEYTFTIKRGLKGLLENIALQNEFTYKILT